MRRGIRNLVKDRVDLEIDSWLVSGVKFFSFYFMLEIWIVVFIFVCFFLRFSLEISE